MIAKPQRLITIFSRHRKGGHTRRLYLTISELLERGFEVHYVSSDQIPRLSHPRLIPHIVSTFGFTPDSLLFWLAFSLQAPILLIVCAVRFPSRAIAVFDPQYALISKLASLISQTPIVLFMRAVPWRVNIINRRSTIIRAFAYSIDSLGLRAARAILTPTETMRRELSARIPSIATRVTQLHNSVLYPSLVSLDEAGRPEQKSWEEFLARFPARKRDVAQRFELSERLLFLVTSGELNQRKNIEHLVRALGALGSERFALIICGDGPEQERIAAVTAGLGLGERVIFAGWIDDAIRAVSGCDLFLMPSMHEGMSNSMLEALGAGVPVIAADTPEMREVLVSDELLFEPTNVQRLAGRLEEILESRHGLDRLRELCDARREIYTFRWGDQIIHTIEQVK